MTDYAQGMLHLHGDSPQVHIWTRDLPLVISGVKRSATGQELDPDGEFGPLPSNAACMQLTAREAPFAVGKLACSSQRLA